MKNYFSYRIYDFALTIYLILFISYLFFFLTPVIPCNVPVFRYALERWTADPYRLMVFHRGQINAEQNKFLKDLKQVSFQGDSTLNLIIQFTDLNNTNQNPLKDYDDKFTYPVMMLFYPEQTGIPYPLWLGELNKSNIDKLKESPIRNEIVDKLLAGETAVFLFLESGKPELDQKYFQILSKELTTLSAQIRIPTSALDIDGNVLEIDDFQNVNLNFTVKKLSRQNSSEKILTEMLLGTESDLSEYQVPMVFPVFGQGRSLYALVGAGINKKTIEKACRSLIDWCSCEIKAMHQGVDLLFSAKWSERAGESWIPEEDLPPLTGLSGFLSLSTKTEKEPEQIKAIASEKMSTQMQTNPAETTVVNSDTARQISNEYQTSDSLRISKNIGWFLLVLTGLIILFTILINKRKMRVKK
jgi:hypothetical protein